MSTAVVLGRFRPPHNAHFKIFEEALTHCDNLLIRVGSTEIPRSIKNPFTYDERFRMIDNEMQRRGYGAGTNLLELSV